MWQLGVKGCLAYYSWKVIIISALFTHNIHSWMHHILVRAMQKTALPILWKWDFSLSTMTQTQSSRLNQRLWLRECREPTFPGMGVASHHGRCCDSSSCSECLPSDFPRCSLQEWGLSTKARSTSHPCLDFVKCLNSISYAFSLLPQPTQLISHCDKCSLALNFSSESWLPKCA